MKYYWFPLALIILVGSIATSAMATLPSMTIAQDADSKQEDDQEDQDDLSLAERMEEVQAAAGADFEKAVELLEEVHNDFPDEFEVTVSYIVATQQLASQRSQGERVDGNEFYYKSAKVAREIMNNEDLEDDVRSLIATAIYNEACSFGVDGKKEDAMKVLKEAFDYGFDKYDLATNDKDFGDLLETDEFKELVSNAEKSLADVIKDKLLKKIENFESFDFDFTVDTLDAEEVSLESLKGKMVVVNFFSARASGSRGDAQSLMKLKSEHPDEIEVVGLAYEAGDDDEAFDIVQRFIDRNELNFPCTLGDEDILEQLPELGDNPVKVFIDEEGTVRFAKSGTSSFDELELIIGQLKSEDE